jgi:hypothetical protein
MEQMRRRMRVMEKVKVTMMQEAAVKKEEEMMEAAEMVEMVDVV